MVSVYGDSEEPEFPEPEEEEEDEEAQEKKGLKEYEVLSDREDIYSEKKLEDAPEEGIIKITWLILVSVSISISIWTWYILLIRNPVIYFSR